ncbi:UDP-glycosyltransferase 83A1 [Amborella trichopoda]|nr:UDP-glycosyltransferase 83A1 [Amborella trichopoda]|eukprot:XP_006837103.2 UDP-glycosyltransferase 83A1 [Amborella trichopoda]
MGVPHALVITYPAQGHIIPMMELSYRMVEHGFFVTFVNTDFTHKRVLDASMKAHPQSHPNKSTESIRLVSIPDGLEPDADRNQLGVLCDAILSSMPNALEMLIKDINGLEGDSVTCVVADVNMGWALDVAKKLGIPRAAVWPAAAGCLTTLLRFQELIQKGVITEEGELLDTNMVRFSPKMPLMDPRHFAWLCIGDTAENKVIYRYVNVNIKGLEGVEWLICNSFYEIESPTYDIFLNIRPIGPLLVIGSQPTQPKPTSLWTEDNTCLEWLDQQPNNSVIYISFGSFTIFNERQFLELSLALENLGRPFLWVARPDLVDRSGADYPEGFLGRVAAYGKVVGWCPQKNVLAHPSIACFVTHCGWNSTLEGLSNGVPFICWPYFADQFLNQTYIVDIWKVGVGLKANEDGLFSKEEIKSKVEEMLGDEGIRERVLKLKEEAIRSVTEGPSMENLNGFMEAMKGKS